MSQAVIATSHRALTSNAVDAARYAEQLLHRICRRWGMRVDEVKDFSGKEGRQRRIAGDTIMRSAVIADWLRELDAAGCVCTDGVNERAGVVSSLTLAILLNTSARSIRRYLAAVRRYQDRRQDPGAAATGQALVKGVTVAACQGVINGTMTGYDRASLEELVEGGGAR